MRLVLAFFLFAVGLDVKGSVLAQKKATPDVDQYTVVSTSFREIGGDAERGAYVLRLAGCAACHTAPKGGKFLAGGRELTTPFGSFFTPNITPDAKTGIGGWSNEDFVRALHEGKSPTGKPYYPAFPYTSYTRMTLQDMLDLKAYLDTVEPVGNPVPDHDLAFPYSVRAGMYVWRALFFEPADEAASILPEPIDPTKGQAWNRGAYIVTGPGHCGECHTPRNFLGALRSGRALSGNPRGPNGDRVPDITGHGAALKNWSVDDVVTFLQIGMKPDGDFVGGAMTDVVNEATGKLTEADATAIATYLKSLPALPAE